MKRLMISVLLVLLVLPVFAAGTKEPAASTVDKTRVTFTVAGNPHRFFHLTPKGCGGDDNIVLANVYDNLLCLENDGSLSYALAESYDLNPEGTIYTCPMHPEIRQVGPGPCPICGMDPQITKFHGPVGKSQFEPILDV